jgi:hypothetical protein
MVYRCFSARRSHAFANVQSRPTVCGEISSTAAVSSTVRPAKNRSSTIRALACVDFLETVERIIQRDDVFPQVAAPAEGFGKRYPNGVAAAFVGSAGAGGIDEHPPHEPRRHGQEVRPVLPVHLPDVHQPQIGLVHERRGLQALRGSLVAQTPARNLAQLVVHERHQPRQRVIVALAPGEEKRGDVGGLVWNAPDSSSPGDERENTRRLNPPLQPGGAEQWRTTDSMFWRASSGSQHAMGH